MVNNGSRDNIGLFIRFGGPERPPLTIVSTYNEQDGTL
jgi:hypothetical protein